MPINSTLDVVVQEDDLIVLGPPNTIDISLDIGPEGDPGSQIYVGSQNPNSLSLTQFTNTYGQSPVYRDIFLRNGSGPDYGTFYSYTSIPGGDQWNEVLNIIDAVELFFYLNTDFILSASSGGTGIDNGTNTLTFTGDINFAGNNDITLNTSGITNILLPMSGSVAVWQDKLSKFASTTSSELASVISDETGTGNLVFNTSPEINTSITTTSASFNLLNTNATTLNFAGAATMLNIGANNSGTTNIRTAATNLTGDLTVGGSDILATETTFNLIDTVATTVNFARAATTLNIAANTGTTTINNDLDVNGMIYGNVTGNVTGNASTATALETARNISLAGDVSGSASFNGTSDITINTTILSNSIVLGTDTTGDYVASITGTSNEIEVSGTGEGALVTIGLPNNVIITNDLTIGGNLTVSGSATYINTNDLYVEDNIILLNSNVTGSPILDAYLEIERGTSPNVSLKWNESLTKWQFTNDGSLFEDLGSVNQSEFFASQFLMMGA